MRDVLRAHGAARASVRGLAQDLAALGRLTLLLAPPEVVAALSPALGGLVELRVHEEERDSRRWYARDMGNTQACPDMGAACLCMGAACLCMGAACPHVSASCHRMD